MTGHGRKLRLQELLAELGALDDEAVAQAGNSLAREELITVGAIVDRAADAGFGFLISMLAVIAIPFFGLSTPFGLAMALCGVQLIVAKKKPWLPKVMRERTLTLATLDRVSGLLARRTRWLSAMTRRRLEFILGGAMRPLIGVAITLLAVGLALPLPIPGSNMIFLIPLFIYAMGLLERDGLFILVGHLCLLANAALAIAFWEVIAAVFSKIVGWL